MNHNTNDRGGGGGVGFCCVLFIAVLLLQCHLFEAVRETKTVIFMGCSSNKIISSRTYIVLHPIDLSPWCSK